MTKADEDAIRDIELRFNDAWDRHDADAMVESLADDAQFVTVNGAWTKTRADYLNLMQRLHGSSGAVPSEYPRDANYGCALSSAGRRYDAFSIPHLWRR